MDLSRLQFSDYSNEGLQVADYSKIEFLEFSDSEAEEFDDDAMEYAHAQGELSFGNLKKCIHMANVCTKLDIFSGSSECERQGANVSGISHISHGLH